MADSLREVINEIISTIVPQSFPMFAHLNSSQYIGKYEKNTPNQKKGKNPERLKNEKVGFACDTCGNEYNSMKKINDLSSLEYPILNLSCKDTRCEYKTNKAQSLAVHSKEIL